MSVREAAERARDSGNGSGCLTLLFFLWLVMWGGCGIGQDVHAIRKMMEQQQRMEASK